MADYSLHSDRESNPRVNKARVELDELRAIADPEATRELALRLLNAATLRRAEAKEEYYNAFKECVEAGASNRRMAEAAGISETGIRLYRKRNGL